MNEEQINIVNAINRYYNGDLNGKKEIMEIIINPLCVYIDEIHSDYVKIFQNVSDLCDVLVTKQRAREIKDTLIEERLKNAELRQWIIDNFNPHIENRETKILTSSDIEFDEAVEKIFDNACCYIIQKWRWKSDVSRASAFAQEIERFSFQVEPQRLIAPLVFIYNDEILREIEIKNFEDFLEDVNIFRRYHSDPDFANRIEFTRLQRFYNDFLANEYNNVLRERSSIGNIEQILLNGGGIDLVSKEKMSFVQLKKVFIIALSVYGYPVRLIEIVRDCDSSDEIINSYHKYFVNDQFAIDFPENPYQIDENYINLHIQTLAVNRIEYLNKMHRIIKDEYQHLKAIVYRDNEENIESGINSEGKTRNIFLVWLKKEKHKK